MWFDKIKQLSRPTQVILAVVALVVLYIAYDFYIRVTMGRLVDETGLDTFRDRPETQKGWGFINSWGRPNYRCSPELSQPHIQDGVGHTENMVVHKPDVMRKLNLFSMGNGPAKPAGCHIGQSPRTTALRHEKVDFENPSFSIDKARRSGSLTNDKLAYMAWGGY